MLLTVAAVKLRIASFFLKYTVCLFTQISVSAMRPLTEAS